jgi:hypothetical protein
MFDSWLWGINKDLKPLALLGAATVSWVIWCHRNDIVFEQKNVTNSLQVVPGLYYISLSFRGWF